MMQLYYNWTQPQTCRPARCIRYEVSAMQSLCCPLIPAIVNFQAAKPSRVTLLKGNVQQYDPRGDGRTAGKAAC